MKGKRFAIKVRVVLVLFLLTGLAVLAQNQDSQKADDQKLREEILSVYKAKGEQGLREFYQKNKDRITGKLIVDFAEAGVNERKEDWCNACEIMAEETKDDKILADTLFNLGKHYDDIVDYKKAAVFYKKALPLYVKLNDLAGQGDVYYNIGNIYHYTSDDSNAQKMYEKALPLYEQDKKFTGLGDVHRKMGDVLFYKGEFTEALKLYEKALEVFKQCKDSIGRGNTYWRIGEAYFYSGNNKKALEVFQKALAIFKKEGKTRGIANIFQSMGQIYLHTGENKKALEFFNKAQPLYEKDEENLGLGNVYKSKGDIYFTTGDNSKALDMFKRALQLFKKVGNIHGEGDAYTNIGLIYLYIGNNITALDMFNKALPLLKESANPWGLGNIFLGKGDLYLRSGNDKKAIEMYDKAFPFFQKAGFLPGQGNVLASKGDVYYQTGELSKAFDLFDQSFIFFEKSSEPRGQGNVYWRKGSIYFKNGNNSEALEMYDKAIQYYEKANNPLGMGNVYESRGNIFYKIGKYESSLKMYETAITFYLRAGELEGESSSLHGKAKSLSKLGKNNQGLVLIEKGIANLEQVRRQTAFPALKKSFLDKVYHQYEETVLFMLKNNFNEKSFQYAEAMKSRVFMDRMAEGLVSLQKGLTSELKKQRDKLVANLSLISKEVYKTSGKKDENNSKQLKEQYLKMQDEFDELLLKIRLNNPLYADVRYPQPVTVQTLQKEVLREGEILVRFFISAEKAYVFLVSREEFKVVPLKIKEEELNGFIKPYLQGLIETNEDYILRYGRKLYDKLFQTLEGELTRYKEIIIVPDGRLETIPFESFVIDTEDGRPVFLLEKYRLKYIQSASVLSQLRNHYQRDRNTNNFIGFGDPFYTSKELGEKKTGQLPVTATSPEIEEDEVKIEDEIKEVHQERYKRSGGNHNRLIKSGEEVNTIAGFFKEKSQKATVYTQEQATEENAKAPDMKDYDFIHFACHGLANDDFQCLILSQDIPGSKEDGYFTLNEIMNCDYNAKLIVLSACQTGSGKLERAEGVTGLTRAMMYAGTPAVVASLWEVDSPATKDLMIAFYRNMLEKGMDKAEALRQAKLELLSNKEYASPTYWSSFVLYGE